MSATVHILNGDSTSYPLQKSGLKGDRIIWREMLCDGPLVQDVGSDAFWMQRYEFFENEFDITKLDYYDKTIKELVTIEDLSNYQEVVLWFEYDLFCQVNLLALCSYLLKYYRKDISYYLVCVGREKGKEGWLTLADYQPEAYKSLYENKMKLSRNDLLYAKKCWDLYVNGDTKVLKDFDFNKNFKFRYLDTAMKQHLKEAKDEKGLDEIAYKILRIIDNERFNKRGLIRELLQWQRKETVYGFGDLQYQSRLNSLKDYYDIEKEVLHLNEKGRKVLV
ncbi:MAG: DUF1835 domain-containing protein [Flavobacteriaceae bacterium]|nr:DUF1835 domain-containing protein [Flavobacteriaceae bacterium]